MAGAMLLGPIVQTILVLRRGLPCAGRVVMWISNNCGTSPVR